MKKIWATFNKYDVEVFYVSPMHAKLNGAHGMTYFDESAIYISDCMTRRMTYRTLIHEFMHFALYAYDVSADDASIQIALDTEEELCYLAERFIPEIYEQARSALKKFRKDEKGA